MGSNHPPTLDSRLHVDRPKVATASLESVKHCRDSIEYQQAAISRTIQLLPISNLYFTIRTWL